MTTQMANTPSLLASSSRVALTAYLHDLGKFAERASIKGTAHTTMAMDILERHAPDLIQPSTFLQWIITTADCVASGLEPQETATGRNHYQARQLSLFEQIRIEGTLPKFNAKDLKWRYPLRELNPTSIFPKKWEDCEPNNDAKAQAEYKALWKDFLHSLETIPRSHRSNWSLWLDHFDTAWLTFTHSVPSDNPDVSLYDHSKTTAALATALWRWHEAEGKTDATAAAQLQNRNDWDEEKILLIQGDFFGIQDFIFSEGSQTNKHAAKLLRGRSFQVSLFTEMAALKVLDALELPPTSQIINAAGKFLIVAPNTVAANAALASVKAEINQWFLQHSFGLAGLGLVRKRASCNDFLKDNFKSLIKGLFEDLEKAKLQRFDLTGTGNAVFDVTYPHGVCTYNDRLPANEKGDAALSRDQITLGKGLTRKDRLLIVRDNTTLQGSHVRMSLEVSVFGFGVAFTDSEDISGKFGEWARGGNLLRCWDFSLPETLTDSLWTGYARRYINAFIPHFTELDIQTQGKYKGIEEIVDADDVRFEPSKTLNHIACEDRTLNEKGNWTGQVALMTLKGDVDNLGTIFQNGFEEPTFAKMAALSRQMNVFFAIWLPAVCKVEFPNTYTVFAGGDDFFLIGPWHSTQKLAVRMKDAFNAYVAENEKITFSAGMVMTKPGLPIHTLATQAEEALDKAKGTDQKEPKNAVVLFGERVRWTDWEKVQASQDQLEWVRKSYDLSTGYVYGLFQLVNLAANKQNPEHAMWRSRFAYRTRRYVVDKLPPEQRQHAQTTLCVALGEHGINELGTKFRIPLFNHFYKQR